ncbi:MAG: hypothetical protein ACKVOU_11010 [Cytophagales bacterium]
MKHFIFLNIFIISFLTINLSKAQDTIISKKGNVYYGYIFKADANYLSFYPDANNKKSYHQLKNESIKYVKICNQNTNMFNLISVFKKVGIEHNTFSFDSTKSVFAFDSAVFKQSKLKFALQKADVIENTFINQNFASDSVKNSFLHGVNDAKQYYNPTYIGQVVFWESFFVPEIALFTNVVASNTSPDEVRCVSDNYEKFNDPNYKAGYKNAALKMKRKQIWKNFAVGGITHVIIVVGLIILL